jgi:8-oxo-dGTP pyrophosphatase MutT (NUDIX family)
MKLPIVNDKDEVIGEEERSVVHEKGLKHREIHVWLVTPDKEFIFQERGQNTDTWPGYFDVTVGGHLDTPEETYEDCAERELLEETGISVPIVLISKDYKESYDPNTNTHNNVFRSTFAGIYYGNVSDLKIEEDNKGVGFRKFKIDELSSLDESIKKKIIPRFLSLDYQIMFNKIISKLFN